mgnify:CR=1 FL=1
MKKTSKKIQTWIRAFRLRTLPLALSSSLVGSFLAYSYEGFSWPVFFLSLTTIVFLQILSNLANDYGDTMNGGDSENRIGPSRVTQTGEVSHKSIRRMIAIFIVLSFTSGTTLIFTGLSQFPIHNIIIFFILGLSAIFAAIKYTAGRNPYGYVGLGDLFVFIYFGLVGVFGTFYLHTGFIDPWIILPATSIGLFSTGVLNLNNLRDGISDKENGKKTVVVRYGVKTAKHYHFLIVSLAVVSSLIYTLYFFESPVQLIFMGTIPFLLRDVQTVMRNKVPLELNNQLKKLSLTTLAFSITFCIGLIFS